MIHSLTPLPLCAKTTVYVEGQGSGCLVTKRRCAAVGRGQTLVLPSLERERWRHFSPTKKKVEVFQTMTVDKGKGIIIRWLQTSVRPEYDSNPNPPVESTLLLLSSFQKISREKSKNDVPP